jgi:hypothetical protein
MTRDNEQLRRCGPSWLHFPSMFAMTTVVATAAMCAALFTPVPSAAVSTSTSAHAVRVSAQSPSSASHAAMSTGLITAGPSRHECVTPSNPSSQTGVSYVQSIVNSFDTVTGTTVNCISTYLNSASTWTSWESPWVTNPTYGYTSWVAQEPESRQLVLEINLIPSDLVNVDNPLAWERACVAGRYKSYATVLGRNLVSGGLQNSVIRLGAEMNGSWEPDFMGTTVVEQRLWARCFAKEVTGLRRATGEHFLIDWNVNACVGNYPYANFYPGSAYVNIIGLDLYDVGCEAPMTPLTFPQLASEPAGLDRFEAFAIAHRKPMSFPEWGLSATPSGDDPAYINGMGAAVEDRDFAFESYFQSGPTSVGPGLSALPLGPSTPLSLIAFRKWFGAS